LQHHRPDAPATTATFPTDPSGLPEAGRPALLDLASGDTLDLKVGPVAKRLRNTTVRMLAYNASIPHPQGPAGSEIIVHVTNDGDIDTTVHWHGLRLETATTASLTRPRPPSPWGEFTYQIQFPDPGLYWYHPHTREDYTQELGLYGNILVCRPAQAPSPTHAPCISRLQASGPGVPQVRHEAARKSAWQPTAGRARGHSHAP
jgi:FtsP/CotA-like multicopper oxidase with cupredoxin domain